MTRLRFHPHGRLQEWVAEENGYFAAEGLNYEFVGGPGQPTEPLNDSEPVCDISFLSFWTIHLATYADAGRQWAHAYWLAPSGIWVAPESPIRTAKDLANVEITLGYLAGTHFAVLQGLEGILEPDEIRLSGVGRPADRLPLALARKVPAVNLYGVPGYIAQQQGFRKILDTSFMIGFNFDGKVSAEELAGYFRALGRAQEDIDQHPERFKHHFLNELSDELRPLLDLQAAGPGERLVFQNYSRESYDRTHQWLAGLEVCKTEGMLQRDYDEVFLR